MAKKAAEKPVAPIDKFDTKVHNRDKIGKEISKDPYRLFSRNGSKYYERPVGSGNLYYENNEPAGRVEKVMNDDGKSVSMKFDLEASHKAYIAPSETAADFKVEKEQMQKMYAAAQKELEELRAEKLKLETNAGIQAPAATEEAKAEAAPAKAVPSLKKEGK